MATSPEELVPGVYRIDAIGFAHAVNVLAIAGDDGWTLVDTGTGGSPTRIQAALGTLGIAPSDLVRIYLTHHHQDHTAGLPGMRAWSPDAEIAAPEYEAEIIEGTRPAERASNPIIRAMLGFAKFAPVPVTRWLGEGDRVAGFRVIATPGHSLGHTSLLSDESGLLFTADAFGAMPRKLRVGVRKAFCADPSLARRSAEKLLGEEYGTVAFSHGPVLRDNPKERLRQMVAECRY
jgi:glyoxylase-like metal-dependent hydrolase (beta-lactamase superfamily II)